MADRALVTIDGIKFFEPELNHGVILRYPSSMSADKYINLPSDSGTIATQEYVDANAVGGSSVSGVYLATYEDRTSTTTLSTLTGMSIALDGSSLYKIEVMWDSLSQGTAHNSKYALTHGGTYIMTLPGFGIPNTTNVDSDGNAIATSLFMGTQPVEITFASDTTLRTFYGGQIITTPAEGTTVEFQFAQVASSGNYERCADAVMIATKLGAA